MSKGQSVQSALRWVGPSGIALSIVAPLTLVLVAYTLHHTPPVPVADALPMPTVSASAQPRPTPTPSASTTTAPQPVVAFLGDSYAAGAGASAPANGWADRVSLQQGWVEKNLSRNLASYSTAGEPSGTSYRSRLGALVATGAQIVVVSGGRNDVGVGAAQFRADVRATLVGIHAGLPKATIVAFGRPAWIPTRVARTSARNCGGATPTSPRPPETTTICAPVDTRAPSRDR